MTAELQIVPFTPEHLEGAWRLSQEAGWPHRVEDWALTLSVSQGVVALSGEEVVGTALCSVFGRVATLNMIIVDARMRGRGLGRRLMDRIIALGEGCEMRLVATSDGLPLYEKLGFVQRGEIIQHQGIARSVEPATACDVQPVAEPDYDRMSALDTAATAMDRRALLPRLTLENPTLSGVFVTDGGFAMLRPFGRGLVLGPVVAETDRVAKSLIAAVAHHCAGKFLRIDMPKERGLADFVETLGLAHVGGGTTMDSGSQQYASSAIHTYGLVSQALG